MKIIDNIRKGSKKYAIKFDEQYDWFPNDTPQELRDYHTDEEDNFEMVNWETNQEKLPVFQVDEMDEEVGGVLVDEIGEEPIGEEPIGEEPIGEEPIGEELIGEEPIVEKPIVEEPIDVVDETVEEETEIDERVPDFTDTKQALQWAVDNNRVIEIFYVTQGKKRGRGGRILRRETDLPKSDSGRVNIHRIVEPHYIYQARNGNTIVITYDRSVRHIRAFIIDNIYDYNFTKNRKTKKDQYFKPRIRVMPKSQKGIKTMENIKNKLTKIASDLDSKGLNKSSLVIKDAIKAASNYKIAQYVGVQGYWLKNRRCWDNCYRQKRSSQPNTSAQEVWMECWDEYKNSINKNDSGWEKYANKSDVIKINKEEEKSWNKIFAKKVDDRVKKGFSRPEAVYEVIESESQIYTSKIIEASSDLMTLANSFVNNGQKEIGKQMTDIAMEMLKEADFGGGWWDKTKDFFRTKGGKIAERLDRLIQKINQIMVNIQGNVATADSKINKIAQPLPSTPTNATPTDATPTSADPTDVTSTDAIPIDATFAMPQFLNPAQVSLYGQFLSDIRQEMGYIFKMQSKNPSLMNITQPAIQSMGQFLTNSDKLFQETGKKTFNREQVMVALSNLLNAITGASTSISPTQQTVPSVQQTVPSTQQDVPDGDLIDQYLSGALSQEDLFSAKDRIERRIAEFNRMNQESLQ